MSPEQRKLLRDALMRALLTLAPLGVSFDTLKGTAKAAGFAIGDDALNREIDYIVKRGLAEPVKVKLSSAALRWTTTADGVEYCEDEGLYY